MSQRTAMNHFRTRVLAVLLILSLIILVSGCGDEVTNSYTSSNPSPEVPLSVSATSGKFIALDWDYSPYLCYNLYWNTTGGVTTSDNVIENVTPPYEHGGLIFNGTSYYYGVTAVNCTLLTESGLSAEVSAVSNLPSSETAKSIAFDGKDTDQYGYTVDISGDYAIVGARYAGANSEGAAYILDGSDNWRIIANLTASDAEATDQFGYSVSISGDYAIVGARYEDGAVTSSNRGAAYIFYRNQGGTDNWGEVIKLTASDTDDDDLFGTSVSISGDYAVVGASDEFGAGIYRGAAYVFSRNKGWGEVKKLTASDTENNDLFGTSVSISGDYVIVGAYSENGTGGTLRGAAYVFYRNEGATDNWGEVKKLTASDTEDLDYFGRSVSISGDYAIVGADGEDGTGGTNRGAAYVFYRNQSGTDNWGEVTKLTASDTEDNDLFGVSVFISGDYAIVGADSEDGAGTDRGAAYVYYRNQGGTDSWGEVKKLTASDTEDGDNFGVSVSISNDYAIVGAAYEDGTGSNRGAVYIY